MTFLANRRQNDPCGEVRCDVCGTEATRMWQKYVSDTFVKRCTYKILLSIKNGELISQTATIQNVSDNYCYVTKICIIL